MLQTQLSELSYDVREKEVTYIGWITTAMDGDTISYATQEYKSYEVAEQMCVNFLNQDRQNGVDPVGYKIIVNCEDCKNSEPYETGNE